MASDRVAAAIGADLGHSGQVDEEPYDAEVNQVAAAQAQLELARRSGEIGSIALAQLNLGATLAALGDHDSAIAQFESLVRYLELASGDDERELQRRLRMLSPSAPPPGAQDVDLGTVRAVAQITMAESLLALGRRDEARAELDRAAPGTRGFGRGPLRKRLAAVRQRMDSATDPAAASAGPLAGGPHNDGPPGPGPAEQVAAADELLASGRLSDSARVALRAIGQCGDDDVHVRAQARQVLGMALDGLGQAQDSQAVLRDSYSDYVAADDYTAAANVAIALAWRMSDDGDRAGAIALLESTLTAAEGRSGRAERVQLLIDLGSLLDREGRVSEARTSMEGALATAVDLGDALLTADARHGLAIILANRTTNADDAVEALSLLDECRRDYDAHGHLDRATGCDHEAAALLGRLGSWDPAAARYRRALAGYQSLPPELRDTGSWPDEVADCELNLAALAQDRADLGADEHLFRSGGHAMSHS